MKITTKMNIVGKDKLMAIGDVVLDDLFVIHDVKVIAKGEDYSVFLPRKAGTNGWSNIVEVTPELYGLIKETVVQDVGRSLIDYSGWKYDMSDVSVQVKVFEKDELRGFATISYKDAFTIKGIQIREKDGELNVVFPYTKQKDGYTSIVGPFPYSHDYFEELKKVVITAYQVEKTKDMSTDAPPIEGGNAR